MNQAIETAPRAPEFDLQKKLTYILETKNKGLIEKFEDFIIPFQSAKFPYDVRTMFAGYSSYCLELGCGWGEFTLESAQADKDTLHIALDKKKYRIKKSVKDQVRRNLPNIRWMVANLEWVFAGVFEKESLDKIIINFPDPWPKSRHQKHRFVGPALIEELSKITKAGGLLEFATDSWSYMEDVIGHFEDSGMWKNRNGSRIILPGKSSRPTSFFENLKRSENENIYLIELERLS